MFFNRRSQGAAKHVAKNLSALRPLGELAAEKGCTTAQLALAWVLAQGSDIVPIPGTKRRRYLEENVAATELNLSSADLVRIDQALPKGSTSGERYPAAIQAFVQR